MSRKGNKTKNYHYFDKSEPKEPQIDATPRVDGKVHVDVYLMVKGVPLWERGGKKAFAVKKAKEFATEKEFETLFSTY